MNEETKKIEDLQPESVEEQPSVASTSEENLQPENTEEQTSDVVAPEENLQPESVEEQPSSVTAPKKTPDKKKIGIIAGIAAAAVVVLAVILILVFGGFGEKTPDDTGVSGEIFTGSGSYTEEADSERDDFITALGGVSETFSGVVSDETFESSTDAAKAFIDGELSGFSTATIQSVNHRGSLSQKQIQSLNIPEDILEGSESVDVIDVSYTLESAAGGAKSGVSAEDEPDSKTVTVIVIKYSDYWKYFTPLPVNGNTVSKSYYDSVFNQEKYKNCTMEVSQDVDVLVNAGGQMVTMTMQLNQMVKYAEGRIYLDMSMSATSLGKVSNTHLYLYVEKVDRKTECYVKTDENSNWIKTSLASMGYTGLDELTPFNDQYLNHTYFTKTSFGFTLADESARKYFSQALMSALEAYRQYIDFDNIDVDMYAEYYVNEGVLSGMRVDADVNMELNVNGTAGTIDERVVSYGKCYDYGTTVIERPNVD